MQIIHKSTLLLTAAVTISLVGGAAAQTHKRLTIVNQCTDDAWAIFTPGGDPSHPLVQANSGAWFRRYAAEEDLINPGWLGTIAAGSKSMTLSNPNPKKPPPGFLFVAGQSIKIEGAGAGGGGLTTIVAKVMNENTVLVLKDAARTAVIKTTILYDTLIGAILIRGNGAARQSFAIPDKGAPGANFRFYLGCPSLANNSKPFGGCVIGASAGDLSGINTLFEPTFGCIAGTGQCAFNPSSADGNCPQAPNAKNCPALPPVDNYDISAVDGYTLPMKVDATGTNCSAPEKDASMLDLGSCPAENKGTLFSTDAKQQASIDGGISLLTSDARYLKACVAPYKWMGSKSFGSPKNNSITSPSCSGGGCTSISYYAGAGCDASNPRLACPANSGPQQRVGPKQDGTFAIQNTHWVRQLYALGYTGYTWQYGDGVGTQTCTAAANTNYTVTLCPNGGKPYARTAKWQFVKATGTCSLATGTGTSYGSLAACQQAKMRYVCDDLTAGDPFKVPGALWRADPTATRKGTGATYRDFQRLAELQCNPAFPVSLPNQPSVKNVPICYYYYGSTPASLCPAGAAGR